MQNKSWQDQSFHLSRRRLAAWHTGIMTLIVVFSELVVHRLVVHARWLNLVGEMEHLARAIEDRIEPTLKQPGTFAPETYRQFPGLCASSDGCLTGMISGDRSSLVKVEADASSQQAVLPDLTEASYCLRFWNNSGEVVGYLSMPADNPVCRESEFWQTKRDSQGAHYHDSFFVLQTSSGTDWGAMQMIGSLSSLDRYLIRLEIALAVITLLVVGLIGFASWWLAGIAMRPVQSSYQQMQQFTADAAHELRTPLAALQAIVQTALRSDNLTPEDAKEALQILNRQSHRLTKLVQDLLMLAQIEQQGYVTDLETCCLNEMVMDLVNEFEALAIAAEIELITQMDASAIYISGNAEQLYRAVANLLSNAIKYTPAKGQVKIHLTASQSYAFICVKDNGVGIPTEVQPNIFDRFYRVDQERSRQKGGTGLGLAITRSIVQAHKGTIRVESKLNHGSVFTISLPLLPA